ncbi:MAG: hypothetical protein K9I92_03260 [Chitinophagaceae bacterium]|nr:hypothetical protein [Chitinophagaceae bacterium]
MKNQNKSLVTLFLAFILITFASCEKVKQQVQETVAEDLIVSIMTSGRWVVDVFTVAAVDVKPEFSGYEFQFLKDGSVEAIKSTTTVKGTWKSDKSAMTIQASFPPGNTSLQRLNYTWNITKTGTTFVEASSQQNGVVSTMRLIKK